MGVVDHLGYGYIDKYNIVTYYFVNRTFNNLVKSFYNFINIKYVTNAQASLRFLIFAYLSEH